MTAPATAPLLAFGPFGWIAAGAIIVVSSIFIAHEVSQVAASVQADERTKPQAVPKTETYTATRSCAEKDRKYYSVRIQAQGTDCGGTTGSTIGVPGGINQDTPVTVAQAPALSKQTIAMLTNTQRSNRFIQIAKAEQYISEGPSVGGYLGKKSFSNFKMAGGIRYDVDCQGSGNSLIS